MKYLFKTLIISIFILSQFLYAGTFREDVSDQEVIDYGKKFFCIKKIVAVEEINEKDKILGIGSCVILNKHWIITCAHLVQSNVDYIKIIIDNKEYCISKFIIHHTHNPDKFIGDIALGYCEEGFGEDIKELQLYEKQIKIDDYCAIAGYGRYGSMLKGASVYDGKLRAGSNRISSFFQEDMVIIDGSNDSTKTKYEFLPNVGDSGGGLFIEGKLAGITSLVMSTKPDPKSVYGDEGAFVQIYPYLEWIKKHVKKSKM